MSNKICCEPDCDQINPQPLEAFHKAGNSKDGHRPNCKSCRKKYSRKRYSEGNGKNNILVSKYGITNKEYEIMLGAQKGKCDICGKHKTEFKHRFAVDHCHKTGKVRALLCGPCNQAIGLLRDSPALCRKAAEYLDHHYEPPLSYKGRIENGVMIVEDGRDSLDMRTK